MGSHITYIKIYINFKLLKVAYIVKYVCRTLVLLTTPRWSGWTIKY